MITYKGLPAPIICDYLSREASRARYAPGMEVHISKIEMVANRRFLKKPNLAMLGSLRGYSDLREAMSIEKRYFTSDLSSLS